MIGRTTRLLPCLLVAGWAATGHAQDEATAARWRSDCANYIGILEGSTGGDDLAVTYCIGQTVGVLSSLQTGSQIGALSMASTLVVAFQLDGDAVFNLFKSKTASELLGICLPEGSRTGEHVRVVYDYLTENPAKEAMPIPAAFFEALSAAYPCDDS